MRFYRVFKGEHASSALTGEGARLFGGRWNSKGTAVVYASDSLSLAILETLVNATMEDLVPDSCYVSIDIPDGVAVEHVDVGMLPERWYHAPAPAKLAEIGDAWVKRRSSAVLFVPSAVTRIERNAVLNPRHADFGRLLIGEPQPLPVDHRLVRGG